MNKQAKWLLLIALLLVATMSAGGVGAWVDADSDPTAAQTVDDESAMPPLVGGVPRELQSGLARPPLPARPGVNFQDSPNAPTITIWYGASQQFGLKGDSQKWVNILGNVSSAVPLSSLTYTINGGPPQALATGADNMRLALTGDFNIELDYTDLLPGANQVVITALDTSLVSSQALVTVNYAAAPAWTPQTYTVNWGAAAKVSDVVQVIDGQWAIDNGTARPTIMEFDRLLGIGDLSWRDYTVTVPITVFGIDESGYTGPSNGPGVGVMVRWQGHYRVEGDTQPRTGWRRLGALGWYRWQRDGSQYTEGFEVLGQGGRLIGTTPKGLDFGVTYMFKLAVQSNPNPDIPATYRFKVWPAGTAEPALWDVERRGFQGEPSGGGLLLLAHHVDARFGTVRVDLLNTRPRPILTVLTDGPGGGSVRLSPSATPRIGEDVVLTAAADLGSAFAGWSGALSGAANPGVVTLFESTTITATFTTGGNGIAMPVVLSSKP